MSDAPRHLPAVTELIGATPQQQQQWLAEAQSSLTHGALDQVLSEYESAIDRLYPDDPGSLFNSAYRHGQRLKAEMKQRVTEAIRSQAGAKVNHVGATCVQVLGYQLGVVMDGAYGARRSAVNQRRSDELGYTIAAELADNRDLQEDLARQRARHAERVKLQKLEAKIGMKREALTAEIEEARRLLDRPHELNLKLHDLLESLLKYQMSLNDRALRNPALADRLRMMGMGLTAVMASVQQLIGELNRAGEGNTPPDPERMRQQSDELLAMAMEQMQQWQHESRSEPDL